MKACEWWTVAALARKLGVARTTLASAVDAGHVEEAILGCGARVVRLESAEKWLASDRRPGRKAADVMSVKRKRRSGTETRPHPPTLDVTP
jgi:hypothetical protein